jgi:EAL domain-containing protein (putative c-di-GMP-specific phosphodiesterase class I)
MTNEINSMDELTPILEHYPEMNGPVHQLKLTPLPFQIGRDTTSNFVIHSQRVSRAHATIEQCGAALMLRDLGSANGTFVNGKKVKEVRLQPGDIIHIAHKEFRFNYHNDALEVLSSPTSHGSEKVPASIIQSMVALQAVLRAEQVKVVFQPIVHLATGETIAFEALGRGTNPTICTNPAEMLRLAEQCSLAPNLSRLFRTVALRESSRIPGCLSFFLNVHPAEMEERTFVDSLAGPAHLLAKRGCRLIVEVNEEAVLNTAGMREFRNRLHQHGIGLAFDDFGAGQSRLPQLAEVPPDFVKIDKELIHGIDQAPARRNMVSALLKVARELHVNTIAEGVETEQEAETLRLLGCQFAQGYLFGRPAAADSFLAGGATKTQTDNLALERNLNRLFSQQMPDTTKPPIGIPPAARATADAPPVR